MSQLEETSRLCDICLPGSHDAGLYTISAKTSFLIPDNTVVTQHLSAIDQLRAGVRVFDFRFFEYAKNDIRIGHFAEIAGKGKADIGAYGPGIDDILQQIQDFMAEGPDETIILRFTHIKSSIAEAVVKKVHNYLNDFFWRSPTVESGHNIAMLRLRDLRGKIIALFEAKTFADFHNQKKGIHTIGKDFVSAGDVVTCAGYSNKKDYQPMVDKQTTLLREHLEHNGKVVTHLAQFYWTLTGGDIRTNTIRNAHSRTTAMANMIRRYKPNIVFYDFCNPTMSKLIAEAGN